MWLSVSFSALKAIFAPWRIHPTLNLSWYVSQILSSHRLIPFGMVRGAVGGNRTLIKWRPMWQLKSVDKVFFFRLTYFDKYKQKFTLYVDLNSTNTYWKSTIQALMLQTPIKQDPSLQDVHSLVKETITKRNKYNKWSLACKNKEPLKSDKLHLVIYCNITNHLKTQWL